MLPLMILVVEANPFTVLVRVLPVDVRALEVALLIADCSEVVAVTPLTVELRTTPLVERVFEFTAVEVLRSEESRVGKECSGECRSRWSPSH